MKTDRFKDYDDEVRDLVLDFERTVLKGQMQFFDVDELEMIIDYYLEVNDLEPLERAVAFAERLYPDSTEVKLRRAHVAIARQQYRSALSQLLALRTKEPDNTDLAYSLGIVYSAMNRPDEAVNQFLAASSDGWQLGRIYGNIAEEYVKKDDLPTALKYYEAALRNEDGDTASLYNYVDTCEQLNCPSAAAPELERYVKHHPYSREGWFCLGLIYLDLGFVEKAIDAFEYALAIDKYSAETYVELAYAYEVLGDVGHAATTLLQWAEVSDNRADALRSVGGLYSRCGNYEVANIYLGKALVERPHDATTLAFLADNYLMLGDTSMARSYLKKAEAIDPDNVDVLSAGARIYDVLDNFEKASDYFEHLIASEMCTEQHCREYTDFLFRRRVYDIMIQFAEESLDNFPHDPFYSTYMAAASFYTNRYNKARKALPDVSPSVLANLCPEIMTHPLLGPLVPTIEPIENRNQNEK